MTNSTFKRRPKPPAPPVIIAPGHVAFRILCHVSNIGAFIGKSGRIVHLLRQETGAKTIHVGEPAAGGDECVIVIVGGECPKKRIPIKASPSVSSDGEDEQEVSPAQDALIRVYERILDINQGREGAEKGGGSVICRVLASEGHVGPVIGKGGKNIDKIRKESGARIRVLPAEHLPAYAFQTDEIIQITGDSLAVKKALVIVSSCLQDIPPSSRGQLVLSGTVLHGTISSEARGEQPLHGNPSPSTLGSSVHNSGRGHASSFPGENISQIDQNKIEIKFRLLCPNDKVGGVIGKRGIIIMAMQNKTGASITVGAQMAESSERCITISAFETPESRYSPTQNAVVSVFTRSIETGIERGELVPDKGLVSARLLISSSQVGCLMGKGGLIISEMRKASGAGIRLLGGDQVPKCASIDDEVVQINGDFRNVRDALCHVTSKLRDNYFPPRSLKNDLDDKTSLAHRMDYLRLSQSIDRPSSPNSWPPQGAGENSVSGIANIGSGFPSHQGSMGLESGSNFAIASSTTVEVVIPGHSIGSVNGENGSNLRRIKEISGADVIVHDQPSGMNDRLVLISGTPDQVQTAQSLLQAFILTNPSSAF